MSARWNAVADRVASRRERRKEKIDSIEIPRAFPLHDLHLHLYVLGVALPADVLSR